MLSLTSHHKLVYLQANVSGVMLMQLIHCQVFRLVHFSYLMIFNVLAQEKLLGTNWHQFNNYYKMTADFSD